MSAPDRLMSISEVAEVLGVPSATVYQWRHRGVGPRGVKVGRYLRFRREDLDLWIEARADPEDGRRRR